MRVSLLSLAFTIGVAAILFSQNPEGKMQPNIDWREVTIEDFAAGVDLAQLECCLGAGELASSELGPVSTDEAWCWPSRQLTFGKEGRKRELWGQRIEYRGRVLARDYNWPDAPLKVDPHPEDPESVRHPWQVGMIQDALGQGEFRNGILLYQDATNSGGHRLEVLYQDDSANPRNCTVDGFILRWQLGKEGWRETFHPPMCRVPQ